MKINKNNGQKCGGSAAILARNSKMTNNFNTLSRSERRKMERELNKLWDVALNNPKYGVCCICGKPYNDHGNNARPFAEGRCCRECNSKYVLPYRIAHCEEHQEQMERSNKEVAENITRNRSLIG